MHLVIKRIAVSRLSFARYGFESVGAYFLFRSLDITNQLDDSPAAQRTFVLACLLQVGCPGWEAQLYLGETDGWRHSENLGKIVHISLARHSYTLPAGIGNLPALLAVVK